MVIHPSATVNMTSHGVRVQCVRSASGCEKWQSSEASYHLDAEDGIRRLSFYPVSPSPF